MFFRNEWIRQFGIGLQSSLILWWSTIGASPHLFAQNHNPIPEWWKDRGITEEQAGDSAVNNSVPVTLGQLKWVATQTHKELSALLPQGLSFECHSLFADAKAPYEEGYQDWSKGNYKVATLGQVKHVAKAFYDELNQISEAWVREQLGSLGHDLNTLGQYPWTDTLDDDSNRSIANLGQLKSIFAFDVRADNEETPDGLPDLFEYGLILSDDRLSGLTINDITVDPGDAELSYRDSSTGNWKTLSGITPPSSGNGASHSVSDLLAKHTPIGSVGGSLSVGGNGAANYSIPIQIPKGTSGVEPSVSINYSSGSGNGDLGVGFSIGGLQSITRGPTNIEIDGFVDGVDFDENDRFYLNGERLVALEGEYGADGTVYETTNQSFNRIVSHGQLGSGPAYWTVQTKAGLALEFGNCSTSCVANITSQGALVWSINKVTDNVGNYYEVIYQRDSEAGALDYRVDHVKYTGNQRMGLSPYNQVKFIWEDRPDKSMGFVSGERVTGDKRVAAIEVHSHGQTLYDYQFEYRQSPQSRLSQLISVTRRASDGTELPPTNFEWTTHEVNEDSSYFAEVAAHSDPNPDYILPQLIGSDGKDLGVRNVDINGDGIGDFVKSYLNGGTLESDVRLGGGPLKSGVRGYSGKSSDYFLPRELARSDRKSSGNRLIDMNQDGLIDVLATNYFDIPEGIHPSDIVIYKSYHERLGSVRHGRPDRTYLIFTNYLTKQDFRSYHNTAPKTYETYLSYGISDVWFTKASLRNYFSSRESEIPESELHDRLAGTDGIQLSNGKFISDEWARNYLRNIAPKYKANVYYNKVSQASVEPFVKEEYNFPAQMVGSHNKDIGAFYQDFTGDGLPDFMVSHWDRTKYPDANIVFVNDGNGGFVKSAEFQLDNSMQVYDSADDYNNNRRLIEAMDVNGDGLADIVKAYRKGASSIRETWLNVEGKRFEKSDAYALPFDLTTNDVNKSDLGTRLVDVNADGLTDIVSDQRYSLPQGVSINDVWSFTWNHYRKRNKYHRYYLFTNVGTGAQGRFLYDHPSPDSGFIKFFDNNMRLTEGVVENPHGLWVADSRIVQVLEQDGVNIPSSEQHSSFDERLSVRLSNGKFVSHTWVRNHFEQNSSNKRFNIWFNTGLGWVPNPYAGGRYEFPEPFIDDKYNAYGVNLIDLNGDGQQDFVRSDERGNKVYMNYGGFYEEDPKWQMGGTSFFPTKDDRLQGREKGRFIDIDSDGAPDIMSDIATSHPKVRYHNLRKPEFISHITDGLGAPLEVSYKHMLDQSLDKFGKKVYEKDPVTDEETAKGIISAPGAGYVVDSYAEKDGLGGERRTYHYYRGRKVDRKNGVDLGFRFLEIYDETNKVHSYQVANQEFPFQGNLKHSFQTFDDPSGEGEILLAWDESEFGLRSEVADKVGGPLRQLIQTKQIRRTYDVNASSITPQSITLPGINLTVSASLLNVVTTENTGFNDHGDLVSSVTSDLDQYRTETLNHYEAPITTGGKWILGRLSGATVTHTAPGKETVTKSSEFSYYSDGPFHGMLKTECASPEDPLSICKTYTYDSFGNQTQISVQPKAGGQVRNTFMEYDETGRFPIKEWNDLGHTATHEYDQTRALLLKSTDANGLSSHFFYDLFGTQILTRGPTGLEAAEITRFASSDSSLTSSSLPHTDLSVYSLHGANGIHFIREAQTSGAPSSTVYLDVQGRTVLTKSIGFGGREIFTRTDYNHRGEAYRSSAPFYAGETLHWTEQVYDDYDRIVRVNQPDGSYNTVVFDGFSTTQTNAGGQTQTRVTNRQEQTTRAIDHGGHVTTFEYDLHGNAVRTETLGGHAVEARYNVFNQKIWMNDTDAGQSWITYNAFGETVETRDAIGNRATFEYDQLGRGVQQAQFTPGASTPEFSIHTTYDTAQGAALGQAHITIKREGLNGTITSRVEARYDRFARAVESRSEVFGESFSSKTTFDDLSRIHTTTNPGGLTILNEYDALGFNVGVRDYHTGELYWKPLTYNAQGKLLTEELGNGVINTHAYDDTRGTMIGTKSEKGSSTLQNFEFTWNAIGNLQQRKDLVNNLAETMTFDDQNRLTQSSVSNSSGVHDLSYRYDTNGNILQKGDLGTYQYGSSRTHAVTAITTSDGSSVHRAYEYDANGAMVKETRGGQTYRQIIRTPFSKADQIIHFAAPKLRKLSDGSQVFDAGQTHLKFLYGADLNRLRQIATRTEGQSQKRTTTTYLGSYERFVHETRGSPSEAYTLSKTEHRHTIAGLVIKTFTETPGEGETVKTRYRLGDHLGSLTALADEAGLPIERYSFDVWGQRRNAENWEALDLSSQVYTTEETNRGYTGHEMLDEVGIVHMNGRLYDAELGRILSTDPAVQEPYNSQNYNRYTYVLNNPVSYTDPSGYFFKKIFKKIKKLFKKVGRALKKVGKWIKENWRTIVAIVIAVVAFYAFVGIVGVGGGTLAVKGGVIVNSAIAGAVAGGANAAINGGSLSDILRGAVVGGLQAALAAGIGGSLGADPTVFQQARAIAAHGVVGGASNVAMGGKFGDGFLSAAVTKSATFLKITSAIAGAIDKVTGIGDLASQAVAAGVIGGTASAVGGGKFANGAWTAAMQHLFNELAASNERRQSRNQARIARQRAAEKKVHYARNKLNEDGIRRIFGDEAIDDPNFSFTKEKFRGENYTGDTFTAAPDEKNVFHRMGDQSIHGKNVKWMLDDGNDYGAIEIVVNGAGKLVTDPMNMGTYNYGGSGISHVYKDIVPWVKYGNSPSDSSTYEFRREQLRNTGFGGRFLIAQKGL